MEDLEWFTHIVSLQWATLINATQDAHILNSSICKTGMLLLKGRHRTKRHAMETLTRLEAAMTQLTNTVGMLTSSIAVI